LFLERYKKILADDGKIIFKTDNKGLFDYSLESFVENGFTVSDVCFDLHSDPVFSKDNIKKRLLLQPPLIQDNSCYCLSTQQEAPAQNNKNGHCRNDSVQNKAKTRRSTSRCRSRAAVGMLLHSRKASSHYLVPP
jgi:tRNA G46 methylase TrmB